MEANERKWRENDGDADESSHTVQNGMNNISDQFSESETHIHTALFSTAVTFRNLQSKLLTIFLRSKLLASYWSGVSSILP
jgi:hypothetical protein